MYAPPLYRSEELAQQHALIEAHSFGMLTATVDGRPHGTHIPFVLDKAPGTAPTALPVPTWPRPTWWCRSSRRAPR